MSFSLIHQGWTVLEVLLDQSLKAPIESGILYIVAKVVSGYARAELEHLTTPC